MMVAVTKVKSAVITEPLRGRTLGTASLERLIILEKLLVSGDTHYIDGKEIGDQPISFPIFP
jgi:hypothetical protein